MHREKLDSGSSDESKSGVARRLTKLVLGLQSTRYAYSFLKLIRSQSGNRERSVLFGALCMYCSKPYIRSNVFGSFDSCFIPGSLADIHAALLNHRHKFSAHYDGNYEVGGHPVNSLFFRVEDGSVLIEDRYPVFDEDYLEQVDELLRFVEEQFSGQIHRILCVDKAVSMRMEKGLYRLDHQNDSRCSIVKIEDENY
ncbi:MAG: hypothetical protein ACF8MJ_05605 [Phycisphaerales bacterium JB050]